MLKVNINKFKKLEHYFDPEHDDKKWSTWLNINNLPGNLFPKALTKKLQENFKKGFINSGEYVGRMDK